MRRLFDASGRAHGRLLAADVRVGVLRGTGNLASIGGLMAQTPDEWLRQADYDMDTADYMFTGQRYFYAVFMCHLSIEKALKGLYRQTLNREPPRVHNLIYLLKQIGLKPPERIGKFIVKLTEASVATRYPEEIRELQKNFTRTIVKDVLSDGRDTLSWIRRQL